jgi:AbrB family looped-hinge helix DNA binding protein
MEMGDTIVVDPNGRVYLPKFVRKLLRLEPNSLLEVDVRDGGIVLKKVDSVAELGRGMFKALLDPKKALEQAKKNATPHIE